MADAQDKTTPSAAYSAPVDAQMRILFDTMSQGVVFRDAEGRIIAANPAAERIIGKSLADLLGRTSAEVHREAVHEDGTPVLPEEFPAEQALRTGAPVTGCILGICAPSGQGRRWISVDATPICAPGSDRVALVYILFEDITERRNAAEALRLNRTHLEQEIQERTRELTEANEALSTQIAVRRRVEQALRESEEKFRRLAENSADLIYVYRLSPEQKFEYVSPSATELTGYTPEEHYARPDLGLQIVHPDDRQQLLDLMAGRSDLSRPLVQRWLRKDGRIIWTEQRNTFIRDDAGRIVALQGIARDITDRIRIEERLGSSEKFLQMIIDTEPECVKMLAADGTLLMMNPSGLAMIDADSLDQVRGQCMYPLINPPFRQAFINLTESIFRGRSGALIFQATGLKGRTVWLETRAVPLRDEKNEIIALLGVTQDITSRRQAEDALRSSESLYHDLVETSQDLIWQCDLEGRYTYLNPAWQPVFGYAVEEMLGKRFSDFQTPERAERDRREFTRLLQSGSVRRFETVHLGRDGRKIHLMFNAKYWRDASGKIAGTRGTAYDITEQKRIENEIRDQEFWTRESQRVAHLGSYVLDIKSGRWTSSEILDAIFGIDGSYDRTIDGWGRLIHPDDRGRMLQHFADVVAENKSFNAEYRIIRKRDGIERWVSGLGELVISESGTAIRMFGTIQDITEHKLSEQALQSSERRLKQLLESVTSYIYTVVVEQGRAVSTFHGPGCSAVTGYTTEDYAADPNLWYRMVYDDDRSQVLDQAATALRGEQPAPLEHRLLHKNGSIIWIRSTIVPRRNERGQLVSYDGLIVDITERKRSEEFVRNILESVDEGFIVVDRDYRIITANRAFGALTGVPAPETIGRHCYEVSHHSHSPCFDHGEECAVRRAFETGQPYAVVHTHQTPSGASLVSEIKAFPLRNETGQVIGAIEVTNNITDRKRLEDQLRHAQKMEAIGLLAGGIAHDFNNILTAIVGYGNLLKMKLSPGDPNASYVDQLLSSAARAAGLTQSLLAFSRKQVTNPRPMKINESIMRVEKLLRRLIGEDIAFATELSPEELTVIADSSQFEQVLMNLATNARDAMPKGGSLAIRAGTAVIGDEFRRAHGFGLDGTYAQVSVIDTGVGMSRSVMTRIFEPFFTTKEVGRGSGLGLAIVYGIVKQNGGYITVDSEPGRGSTFHLYFPLVAPQAETSAPEETAPLQHGRETVLVAEDDDTLRELTKTMLTDFGYTVIEAVDGEDACQQFQRHQAEIQLVILDVVMPRMNGKDVHDRIVQTRPDTPVLFLSGYTSEILREKGIDAATANVLLKPVSPMDLLRAVRRILDSSVSPRATAS
ncbi:MAG: PAS domain S-box protein [Nitrospiraceae bacterium]|nr:PAS domain S-box protein [Nitrospiraceae bacterium]